MSRKHIFNGIDASLTRLGTDYLDIYYLHREDHNTPLEVTVAAIGELIRQGKIRYWGLSNYRGWRISEVMRVAEPGAMLAETYRETARETGDRQDVIGTIAGGTGIVRVQVSAVRSAIDAPAGSFYVPLNQPRANLAVAALEPDTQNSYFANHLIDELGNTARIMSPPALVFEDIN